MRKLTSFCIIGTQGLFIILCVVFLLYLMTGCATLQNLIGQPQLQTYTFNYDGGEYSALLPKEVPMPPQNANSGSRCLWSSCIYHIEYRAGKEPIPRYPVASFWFTKELGVFGFVWHTLKDGNKNHEGFLYIKGLPVSTSMEDFNKFLDELAGK